MPACSIKWCGAIKNKNLPQLSLHRFPRNEDLKKIWVEAIGEENINRRQKQWYLCSLHFEERCFKRTLDVMRLHDYSVPTLFSMCQQDLEQVETQYGFSTEVMEIKAEPETHNEDTPHVHDTHMDTDAQSCSEEYLKFKILNEELMIKDEPVGHNIVHEATINDESNSDDELTNNTQLKSSVPSENVIMERSDLSLLKSKKEAKQVKCHICGNIYASKTNLKVHLLIHSGDKPFKCNICDKTFNQSSNMKVHIRTHNRIKCKFCPRTFKYLDDFNYHNIRNHPYKPHKCKICNKSFSLSIALRMHTRIHSKEEPQPFEICNTFKQLSDSGSHIRVYSGKQPNQFNTCDKTLQQSSNLSNHIRVYADKPHKCKKCKKTFGQSINLRRHISMVHSEKVPYPFKQSRRHKCKKCNKIFSKVGYLRRHIQKIHYVEQHYKCDICNKTYKQFSHLSRHIHRIHSEEQPYQFNICNKVFKQSNNLVRHIYAEKKPHKCKICGKVFIQYQDLKDHEHIHKNKSYNCYLCGQDFTHPQQRLKYHLCPHDYTLHDHNYTVCAL